MGRGMADRWRIGLLFGKMLLGERLRCGSICGLMQEKRFHLPLTIKVIW